MHSTRFQAVRSGLGLLALALTSGAAAQTVT